MLQFVVIKTISYGVYSHLRILVRSEEPPSIPI